MNRLFDGMRLTAFAPALASLVLLAGCGGSAVSKSAAPERVAGLRVETVRLEKIPKEIEAPGTVTAVRTAQLAARIMGTVDSVAVHEGDHVRRGQLLVALDDREFSARLAAAQAGLAQAAAGRVEAERGAAAARAQADMAQKTYQRYVYLQQQKSVSPQEFDEVEAKQLAAQAMLQQALAREQQAGALYDQAQQEMHAASTVSSYARITAPFDGVVLHRYVDPGAMAAPGSPLLVVEDSSRYRLEATLDAGLAGWVHRGNRVRVELDALPGRNFPGTVSEIEPGANPASHTVNVKIDLPHDPALRSGLFGRAWFRAGEQEAIVVPESAVLDRGQLHGLYVLDSSGLARFRLVTLGSRIDSQCEVLSGLSAGEEVVTDPGARELDGKKVEAGS